MVFCKAVPLHAMEALGEERRYSSYSFSTSALGGGEWSRHASKSKRNYIKYMTIYMP
jgi:hypothetical protein